MEQIIRETRRPHTWFYEDGFYICEHDNGTIVKKIHAHLWPDPMKLKDSYIRARLRVPEKERKNFRIEPDPVVVAIWNDYQKRKQV